MQCIAASKDGIHFDKYRHNPVLPFPPAEASADFRDPKVWQHEGTWYMVVGSSFEGKGQVLLYKSADLQQWDYVGVAIRSDGSLGSMWECPDLFPLGDKYMLIVSLSWAGEQKNIYFLGSMLRGALPHD